MSYSTFLSDRQAVRERGDWLVELYLISPLGVATTLRYSRRGTIIGPSSITVSTGEIIPANTPYRKRLITAPTSTQYLWQSGQILSDSIPSYGSMTFNNLDGGLDQYRPINGWIWSGQKYKVFFGDSGSDQLLAASLGKSADGYLGMPVFTLTDVTVPLSGYEILFGTGSQSNLQAPMGSVTVDRSNPNSSGGNPASSLSVPTTKRVFRGSSYMLELSAARTVGYGAAGTPAAVAIRGDLTLESWIWIDTYPNANVTWWGWMGVAGGAGRPWWLVLTSTGQVILASSVGGASQTVTTTTTLTLKTMFHLSIVVSGVSATFYFWNDDAQTLTTETFVNAFTATPRDALNAGATYALATANVAVIWHDEMRVWNVARTQSDIEADRFHPFIAGSIPVTLVHYVTMDDGTGTTPTDSSATAANGTITGAGTSTWLHAQEGESILASTPKPDVWGERWGVAPVLVDPVRQGYMIAGGQGGVNSITTYEGASPHTMDATAASYRAYLTTTPAAGHSLPYLARGLFKLGSKPTLPVSALVKGYNGGALGYVNTGATITRDMITRRGPKIADPASIDTASFTAYNAALPYIMGCFYATPVELGTALDFNMASGGGWWGYLRATALFHIQQLTGPSLGTPDYALDQRRIIDLTPLPAEGVVYEVIVRFRHNDVVLKENEVAAAVAAGVTTVIMGTSGWQQWTMEWQSRRATDETLRAQYGNTGVGISLTIDTGLQYAVDALALAKYLLSILKGVKDGWAVTLDSSGLQLTPGMSVSLSVTLQSGAARLNLDGTSNYLVMSVADNRQQGTIQIDLWGATAQGFALVKSGSTDAGLIGDGTGSMLV